MAEENNQKGDQRIADFERFTTTVSDLQHAISSIDTKVSTAVALLTQQSERQDRSDNRIDRMEERVRENREIVMKEMEEIKRHTAKEMTSVKQWVNLIMGGVAVLAFVIPVIVTLVTKTVIVQ